MNIDTVMLSVRSMLQSPGLYSIWMSGSNGRSVAAKVTPKSCERNSLNSPTSDTSPVSITWKTQTGDGGRRAFIFKSNRRSQPNSTQILTQVINKIWMWRASVVSTTYEQNTWFCFPQAAHLARMVRTDSDAELSLNEGVIDQVCNVLESLPIVFTNSDKIAVRSLNQSCGKYFTSKLPPLLLGVSAAIRHVSPPVEVRLAEAHHEQRYLECCEDQQHLERREHISRLLKSIYSYLDSNTLPSIKKLTPDPSPTQASEREPMVFTWKANWK